MSSHFEIYFKFNVAQYEEYFQLLDPLKQWILVNVAFEKNAKHRVITEIQILRKANVT